MRVSAQKRKAPGQNETLQQLVAITPDLIAVANELIAEQKLAEATKKIDYALSLAPENPDYWNLKGNLLQAQLQFQEAGSAYLRTLDLAPDYPNATANAAFM